MLNYIKVHKSETFFVFLITIFALVLRLVALHNFGDLWVDELFSFYFANKKSLLEILASLFCEDFHVPLYFVLLHYWIKIFGQSDFTLRVLGCILTTCSIPVCFYVVKNLFGNKTCAYLSALFLAIQAFNIHYSTEVRFYGMSITLILLSSYFFAKLVQNILHIRYAIGYLLSSILLLYTYNFSFMFVFCQFIIGLVYILLKKKESLFKFIKIYLIIAFLYIPVLIYILHNIFMYKNAILSFYRDVIGFEISLIFTYFLTCFSNIFDQFITNDIMLSRYMLKNIFNLYLVAFAVIPISIGFVGLINVVVKKIKDTNFILFSVPSIILILIQLVLVLSHQLALTFRYTVATTTVLLIISVCGVCLLKNKFLRVFLISLWLFVNCTYYFVAPHSALNRQLVYTKLFLKEYNNTDIKSSDYVMISRFGKVLTKYVNKGIRIDFDTYDAFLLGIRPYDIEFIFGKNFADKLNRKNAKTYLYEYLITDYPSAVLVNNLHNKCFSQMKKGQKFILITDETNYMETLPEIQAMFKNIDSYRRSAIYYPLAARIVEDIIFAAGQDLKLINVKRTDSFFSIFVFEK